MALLMVDLETPASLAAAFKLTFDMFDALSAIGPRDRFYLVVGVRSRGQQG